MTNAQKQLPVTVIGGYLGAGKTTLVNHLLRHADGRRLAVLVNDFGALPIDESLIESRDGNVIGIAGGCICCSYGSALMEALQDVARLSPRPDHVLLETSGVALPGAVADSLTLLPDYAIDAVVVLADAETVTAHGADPYLGDTITRQLRDADIAVLNKADLATAGKLEQAQLWIARHASAAAILVARKAEVPLAILIGAGQDRAAAPTARCHGHATAQYASFAASPDRPLDIAALRSALRDPALGILRAKGFVRDGSGVLHELHAVGNRVSIAPFAGRDEQPAGVVVIGLRDRLDAAVVRRLLASPTAEDRAPQVRDGDLRTRPDRRP